MSDGDRRPLGWRYRYRGQDDWRVTWRPLSKEFITRAPIAEMEPLYAGSHPAGSDLGGAMCETCHAEDDLDAGDAVVSVHMCEDCFQGLVPCGGP